MSINLGNQEVELNKATVIVSETDAKGNIIYANDDFCKIAGYSKKELIGKPHNMVRNSFMPKAAFKDLWDTVKKGTTWNGIVVNSTKSGGYYWVNATVFQSKTVNGDTRYISVRTKPTKEEIAWAYDNYPTLDAKMGM